MNKQLAATLSDLRQILVLEDGEALSSLDGWLSCACWAQDMRPYTGDVIWVRESVKQKLLAAQRALEMIRPGYRLKIAYGYRHPEVQRLYWEQQKAFRPNSSDEEIHQLIAHPEVAGHPTGGAVDVTLEYEGEEVDMGSRMADFTDTERIRTFFPGLANAQKENRSLLLEVMVAQGFAPFFGEWWHFSYGDREWSFYYDMPHAIYSKIF